MQPKVSIIGAGNVGGSAAHLILQRELSSVVLVDVVSGLPQGKALDLEQSGFIEGYRRSVSGTNNYKDIEGSNIVLITAGITRKPGMDRLDLLNKNALVIEDIVKHIVQYCPDSIIIIMTNPVDVLTYHAWKLSGFPSTRVMGQAGVLDTARFKYFASQEISASVETMVLGGHGDTMVPILRKPVTELLSEEKLESIVDKARKGGAEIVSLMRTSAYYAPAAAAVAIIEAILKDTKETMPVSAYLNGEYGIEDVYIGVPVVLGRSGIEKIVEIELTAIEKEMMQRSTSLYKESIKKL